MRINQTDRTERRNAIHTTRRHMAELVNAHQNNSTPAGTVSDVITRLGYDAALTTIAELVNTVSSWDERVTSSSRAWAQNVTEAATSDELRATSIFQPTEIHPAHIDQIARAMQNTPRPVQEEPTVEDHSENNEPLPAQEAQNARKTYTYTDGHAHQETDSATKAMTRYREGKPVTVCGRRPNGSQYHVTIQGQQPAQKEDENRKHCKWIALELEAYANGQFAQCPECGEKLTLPDDVGDKYRCPECGTVHVVDGLDTLTIWDYINDNSLDIEYRIDSDRKTVHSVEIIVTFGGPNICIDTGSRAVELYWWGDRASYPINPAVCDEIDDWAQELFDCR